MSVTPAQTRLQAGMWLLAAADELQRLRDGFMATQLHAAPQHIAELPKHPSAIVRQYTEVLPREMPLVAGETNASPFTIIERVASNRTGSPTKELQQASSSEHDSSPVGRPSMRGLLQVANPDPEHPPHTVNERVASDDSGSLSEELQQVYWDPTPGYDWSQHEMRGLLQVANPGESSTVNERVVSNNFASLTEELQQIYQSSSSEDNYPQYELPGILRVTNPKQEATRPQAHCENEEEYGDAGYYYDQSEEDDEYIDHLYKLRASVSQPYMSQSRHTQHAQLNHRRRRIFERSRQPLSRFLGGSCI
jgi:hypothetical protein